MTACDLQKRHWLAAAGMALIWAAGLGVASAADESRLDRGERKFVEQALVDGMVEVELGKLAQQKGSSDQVKQFGARMVQDHTKAGDELKAIAGAKGIQVPAALPRDKQRDVEKLSKRTGADFDREYMQHMVKDHRKAVADHEKQARSAKDPQIKDHAAKTLPTLQEHLKMAQAAEDAVKLAARK